MSEGACKLCDKHSIFVKSHIIPRSFYGKYGKTQMTSFDSLTDRETKYRKGIYSAFLCLHCEQKFQYIDQWANEFLLRKQKVLASQQDNKNRSFQFLGIKCTLQDKQSFAFFALTVLWRAHSSQRQEYRDLKIGEKYEQLFKKIINSNTPYALDLSAVSVSAWFFEGSAITELDSAFVPLVMKQSKNTEYGKFKSWLFGFPNGRLQIRLGGENPKYGFLNFAVANSTTINSVLWSNNLSEAYDWLLVPKCPRDLSDSDLISTLNFFQKM